jgi:hypothetical protein
VPDPTFWKPKAIHVQARQLHEAEMVDTVQGPVAATAGNWVVTSHQGEVSIWTDAGFRAKYERA